MSNNILTLSIGVWKEFLAFQLFEKMTLSKMERDFVVIVLLICERDFFAPGGVVQDG